MNPQFAIAAAAVASFLLAGILVLTAGRHGRFTMDLPGAVQTFHSSPTPRIGGIGIYLALVLASRLLPAEGGGAILDTILLAGIPALLVGLMEDVTHRTGVFARLAATMASGALACWVGGVSLTHLQIPFIDPLLAWPPLAVLVTIVAVAGVSNAFNIIDGFHGLASGTAVIALAALAFIAALVGDTPLMLAGVVLAAAIGGFWLVNFPWGKLFLGDGGAYLAGFAIAWLAVLLPMRNPSVSPWASLLVCGYPVIEVVYSMWRRRRGHAAASGADRGHLHSLVAIAIVNRHFPRVEPVLRNSAVSVLMWMCAAFPALLGVTLYAHTPLLIASAATSLLLYHVLYRWVARK